MNYKIDLIIDNRERDICKYYNENKIENNIKYENLDLGDIIIKINNKIVLIIERKSLSDLSKSIKDGRYKEQKNRIIHSLPYKVRKMYLIEGNNFNNFHMNIKTFDSMIYNTMIRDNLHILRSNSIESSISIINNIYLRCKKFKDKIYNNIYGNDLETFESICHIKKKNNLTKEVCYINQLQQIPSVSKNIASIILNKYGNLQDIYLKYNNEEKIKEFKYELSEIKYGKSMKRIGNKISIKITNYLFNM
jgi:ERCC4-type nuclease